MHSAEKTNVFSFPFMHVFIRVKHIYEHLSLFYFKHYK